MKRYVCIECGGRRWLTPVEWWVSVCQVCEGELEEDESDEPVMAVCE